MRIKFSNLKGILNTVTKTALPLRIDVCERTQYIFYTTLHTPSMKYNYVILNITGTFCPQEFLEHFCYFCCCFCLKPSFILPRSATIIMCMTQFIEGTIKMCRWVMVRVFIMCVIWLLCCQAVSRVCVVGVEQGSSWQFMRGLVSHFREMMVWWIGQRACALSLCVCVCMWESGKH